ncbi:Uncharacterized protein TPAR_07427 [Tolypocladium paradoxum]|uniref:Uncharacterized protein n=1 Tax=Tolypocladium paradoxum TaxID=94208 RepID=A0A2S4KQ97_9HYPO|nr:Uncharacterized protein TPAR_07427 [Tolypocladium paradoxum]
MAKDKRCSSRGWGYLAANVPDPPACITDCRRQLLQAIVPSNETLGEVCKAVTDSRRTGNDQVFRMVYCCDSQVCGVDNLDGRGKDPNVNWLRNACQNIGYHSVVDPGPPDATYSCKYVSTDEQDSSCTIQQPTIAAETAVTGASSASGAFESEDNNPHGMAESQLTVSSTTATQSPQATSTRSFIRDPSLATSLYPPEASTQSDEAGELSTGIKVTIALSTIVGVVVILALILWHLRLRRRSHPRARMYNRSNKYHNSSVVPDSPTPLVSPTDPHANPGDVPLTPPPRLRERRLLRTTANNWPLCGGEGLHWAGCPDSSLRSSTATATEMSPPSRGGTKANGDEQSSPRRVDVPRPLPAVTTGQYVQGSMGSTVHTPTTTASTASTVVAPAGYEDATAYSPPRTPRQRHMPLQVAGLTSPGPPPNRALPSTPLDGQRSPPATPTRPEDDTMGVAITAAPEKPAPGVALPRESSDLCELTVEYARQSQHSWGSWSGRGGGGSGVAVSPLGKGRDVSSSMLEEGELERLGGSYK